MFSFIGFTGKIDKSEERNGSETKVSKSDVTRRDYVKVNQEIF